MPYCFLFFKSLLEQHLFFFESVENDTYIIGLEFSNHFLISLREYHCRECSYFEFLGCLRAGFLRKEEVFDRWMITKDRDTVFEIGFEG
jgi:hypothetical protein